MEQELISIRNLVSGDIGTPLRKLTGVLDGYAPEDRKYASYIVLNFTDVEVLESSEPYNFLTAQIAIKVSNRKSSGWGVFSDSLALLLSEDEDIKDCIGKRFGMEMEIGHVYGQDRQTGEDMLGNPWKVYELEGAVVGVESTTAMDKAKELLDGKTKAEFNKAAYADPVIRKDTELQRAITDKSFINSLTQLEEFTEDENGVFHKVIKEG